MTDDSQAWRRPTPAELRQAVDLFLAAAYEGGPVPQAVRVRVQALQDAADDERFYELSVFERSADAGRIALRLGNRAYPHMKLLIQRAPSGGGYLLSADTHDAHCCPAPGTREYECFCGLMEKNRAYAERIEHSWEAAGLPTFKQFLREDLERRRLAFAARGD